MKLRLYIEAAIAVLIARIATRTISFASAARFMGWQRTEVPDRAAPAREELIEQVGRAVVYASRLFRLSDPCLAESMAAKWMLDRRGEATLLCFGMRIKGKAALSPRSEMLEHAALHAWVLVGNRPVTPQKLSNQTLLSSYR